MKSRSASQSLQTTRFSYLVKDDENKIMRNYHKIRTNSFQQLQEIPKSLKELLQDFEVLTYLKSGSYVCGEGQMSGRNVFKTQCDIQKQVNRKKRDPNEMKIKRYQALMKKQYTELKKSQMINHQKDLKQDLKFLDQLSTNGLNQFVNKLNLYQKFYSQELIDQKKGNYKREDLNIQMKSRNPMRVQSAQATSFRKVLYYKQPEENQLIKKKIDDLQNLKIDIRRQSEPQNYIDSIKRKIKNVDMTQEQFEFLEAVKQNDLIGVRLSLKMNKELVNTCDRTMENGLHWCAKRNYIEIADLLIQNGINIYSQNIGNKTAEQIAQQFQNYKIVKLLQMEEMERKKREQDQQIN